MSSLGGGFRDSLADMAEELCPCSMDDPMPLEYFVRTPNQVKLTTRATYNTQGAQPLYGTSSVSFISLQQTLTYMSTLIKTS
jgi:hypothetical protein